MSPSRKALSEVLEAYSKERDGRGASSGRLLRW